MNNPRFYNHRLWLIVDQKLNGTLSKIKIRIIFSNLRDIADTFSMSMLLVNSITLLL